MNLNNFIEGLKIFQGYSGNGSDNEPHIGAAYCEFYINVSSILITKQDRENLLNLGWTEDSDIWIAPIHPCQRSLLLPAASGRSALQ